MKQIFSFAIFIVLSVMAFTASAQEATDKSKRPSPPASVTQTITSGATVHIDYSQPSVKGRTIGKDLEPKDGTVWRTGANEATVFEIDKDVKINGQTLLAGKYGLFSISGKDSWVIIFNKTWKQWGAYDYKESEDALRINVKPSKAGTFSEKMTFVVDKNGTVNLFWGDIQVGFEVK
ncbi:MAG: DUF2911 domain-containing protein [Ferruginibacter sp.]